MNKFLKPLSTILLGGCVGIIIDFITGLSFIFTALGLVAGVILMLINKRREKND